MHHSSTKDYRTRVQDQTPRTHESRVHWAGVVLMVRRERLLVLVGVCVLFKVVSTAKVVASALPAAAVAIKFKSAALAAVTWLVAAALLVVASSAATFLINSPRAAAAIVFYAAAHAAYALSPTVSPRNTNRKRLVILAAAATLYFATDSRIMDYLYFSPVNAQTNVNFSSTVHLWTIAQNSWQAFRPMCSYSLQCLSTTHRTPRVRVPASHLAGAVDGVAVLATQYFHHAAALIKSFVGTRGSFFWEFWPILLPTGILALVSLLALTWQISAPFVRQFTRFVKQSVKIWYFQTLVALSSALLLAISASLVLDDGLSRHVYERTSPIQSYSSLAFKCETNTSVGRRGFYTFLSSALEIADRVGFAMPLELTLHTLVASAIAGTSMQFLLSSRSSSTPVFPRFNLYRILVQIPCFTGSGFIAINTLFRALSKQLRPMEKMLCTQRDDAEDDRFCACLLTFVSLASAWIFVAIGAKITRHSVFVHASRLPPLLIEILLRRILFLYVAVFAIVRRGCRTVVTVAEMSFRRICAVSVALCTILRYRYRTIVALCFLATASHLIFCGDIVESIPGVCKDQMFQIYLGWSLPLPLVRSLDLVLGANGCAISLLCVFGALVMTLMGLEFLALDWGYKKASNFLFTGFVREVHRIISTPPPTFIRFARDGVSPIALGTSIIVSNQETIYRPILAFGITVDESSGMRNFECIVAIVFIGLGVKVLFNLAKRNRNMNRIFGNIWLFVESGCRYVLSMLRQAAFALFKCTKGAIYHSKACAHFVLRLLRIISKRIQNQVILPSARAISHHSKACAHFILRLFRVFSNFIQNQVILPSARAMSLAWTRMIVPFCAKLVPLFRKITLALKQCIRFVTSWILFPLSCFVIQLWPLLSAVASFVSCKLFLDALLQCILVEIRLVAALAALLGLLASFTICVTSAGAATLNHTIQRVGANLARNLHLGSHFLLYKVHRLILSLLRSATSIVEQLSRGVIVALIGLSNTICSMLTQLFHGVKYVVGRTLGIIRKLSRPIVTCINHLVVRPIRAAWSSPIATLALCCIFFFFLMQLHSSGLVSSIQSILHHFLANRIQSILSVGRRRRRHFVHDIVAGTSNRLWHARSTALRLSHSITGNITIQQLGIQPILSSAALLHASPFFGVFVWGLLSAVVSISEGAIPPRALAIAHLAIVQAFWAGNTVLFPLTFAIFFAYVLVAARAAQAARRDREGVSTRLASAHLSLAVSRGLTSRDARRELENRLQKMPAPGRIISTEVCVICLDPLKMPQTSKPDTVPTKSKFKFFKSSKADLDEHDAHSVCALRCGHEFHSKCMADWLSRDPKGGRCPSCRAPVRWQLEYYNRALLIQEDG